MSYLQVQCDHAKGSDDKVLNLVKSLSSATIDCNANKIICAMVFGDPITGHTTSNSQSSIKLDKSTENLPQLPIKVHSLLTHFGLNIGQHRSKQILLSIVALADTGSCCVSSWLEFLLKLIKAYPHTISPLPLLMTNMKRLYCV